MPHIKARAVGGLIAAACFAGSLGLPTAGVADDNVVDNTLDSYGLYDKHLCGQNGTWLDPQEWCPGVSPRHHWKWAVGYRDSKGGGIAMCVIVNDKDNDYLFSRCSNYASAITIYPSDLSNGAELTRIYNKNNNVTFGSERRFAYADTKNYNSSAASAETTTLGLLADAIALTDNLALSSTTAADNRCYIDEGAGFCTPADKLGQDFGVTCKADGSISVFGVLPAPGLVHLQDGTTVAVTPDARGLIQLPVQGVPTAVQHSGQFFPVARCSG